MTMMLRMNQLAFMTAMLVCWIGLCGAASLRSPERVVLKSSEAIKDFDEVNALEERRTGPKNESRAEPSPKLATDDDTEPQLLDRHTRPLEGEQEEPPQLAVEAPITRSDIGPLKRRIPDWENIQPPSFSPWLRSGTGDIEGQGSSGILGAPGLPGKPDPNYPWPWRNLGYGPVGYMEYPFHPQPPAISLTESRENLALKNPWPRRGIPGAFPGDFPGQPGLNGKWDDLDVQVIEEFIVPADEERPYLESGKNVALKNPGFPTGFPDYGQPGLRGKWDDQVDKEFIVPIDPDRQPVYYRSSGPSGPNDVLRRHFDFPEVEVFIQDGGENSIERVVESPYIESPERLAWRHPEYPQGPPGPPGLHGKWDDLENQVIEVQVVRPGDLDRRPTVYRSTGPFEANDVLRRNIDFREAEISVDRIDDKVVESPYIDSPEQLAWKKFGYPQGIDGKPGLRGKWDDLEERVIEVVRPDDLDRRTSVQRSSGPFNNYNNNQ